MKKIKIDIKAIIVIALVLIIILAENDIITQILVRSGSGKAYIGKYMGIYMLFHVYEVSTQATFSIIYYVFNYILIALILFLYFLKKKNSLIPSAILLIEKVLSIFGIFALKDYFVNYLSLNAVGVAAVIKMFRISPDTYVAIICLIAIIVIVIMNSNFKKQPKTITSGFKADSVEEIMKYKKLCDSGVITQEEYDEKKAELLG